MNSRNPVGLSERCGVSTAEKIGGSSLGSWLGSLSGGMALNIREQWLAKNLADRRRRSQDAARRARPPAEIHARDAQRLRKARVGKAADVKGRRKRIAADAKAAAGALPQWTTAEIEEAFRRFQAARPEPKGELEHINPFTLLVAVVLSAQATDAGVNKATPALFAAADTPAAMAALGEDAGAAS